MPDSFVAVDSLRDPPPPIDDLYTILTRYTVAFFKVHVEGDESYQPFLTPEAADSDPRLTVIRTGGSGGQGGDQ